MWFYKLGYVMTTGRASYQTTIAGKLAANTSASQLQ